MMQEKMIIKKLLNEIPDFMDVYRDLIDDYDGKIPTYIIFGELARFFILQVREKNKKTITNIQNYLEKLLKYNDKNISELVVFGFLENLDQSIYNYEKIQKTLTPTLAKEFKKLKTWWKKEPRLPPLRHKH